MNLTYICDNTVVVVVVVRMREKVGLKVVKALKRHDDGVTHAAIDMLCALVQVSIVLRILCALVQVKKSGCYILCARTGQLVV